MYCRFGNFRVTFISRIFDFRIIREVLNSRASIRVVGHFRGMKLGMQIVAVHFFDMPTLKLHSL